MVQTLAKAAHKNNIIYTKHKVSTCKNKIKPLFVENLIKTFVRNVYGIEWNRVDCPEWPDCETALSISFVLIAPLFTVHSARNEL